MGPDLHRLAVDVASYATQSGSTGPQGVTAQMVLYDMTLPAAQRPPLSALVGKIVVVKQAPFSGAGIGGGYTDSMFRTDADTFLPQGTFVDPTYEASYRNRHQFGFMGSVINQVFRQTVPGPVAHIAVLDMPPGAAQGGRQHGTPARYEVPGLLLDKKNGAKVIEDARAGKTATLTLDAKVEADAQAYSLMVTLPGKDFGTPKDTAVMMATHTDGPSVNVHCNKVSVQRAIEAVSDNKLPRAQVNSEECLGVNGQQQNNWFGRNFAAHLENLGNHPVWHVTGDWPSTGYQMVMDMNRFNADVFRAQVGSAVQLVGTLMRMTDLLPMSPSWPLLTEALTVLQDDDFVDAAAAAARRAELLAMDKTMFDAASTGNYVQSPAQLDALKAAVLAKVKDVSRRTTATGLVDVLKAKVAAATQKK